MKLNTFNNTLAKNYGICIKEPHRKHTGKHDYYGRLEQVELLFDDNNERDLSVYIIKVNKSEYTRLIFARRSRK